MTSFCFNQSLMLKIIFKRLYHSILYLIAFAVLTSAIVITLVRLALPGIGGYRQQTQDWISQYMNYPVVISNIDADWNSWNPKLHLHQVSILDPVSNKQILKFQSVLIRIDILKSLIRNEIIPKTITISDLSLTLIRRQDGSITASEYLPDDFKGKQLNNDALAKWFLAQKDILVKKAQITLLDLNGNDAPLLLSDVTLRIRNNDYRTQIEGSAVLPESYGHILNFALDASGDLLTPDWSGEMYFEGKDINISPLFLEIEDLDIESHEGTGDIKIWSTWNQAKLRKLEGQIKLHELKLANKQSEVYIRKIAGSFSATRRTDSGIELTLDLEELITPNGEWPETVFSLKKIYIDEHDKYRYIASASYLKLDDIDSFLNIFSDLPEKFYPSNNFDITGVLQNTVIKYDPTLEPDKKIYIDTGFSQLGGQFNDIPLKLEGFSGQIQGTRREGSVHIATNSAELELDDFLVRPLTFYELNTELNWQYKDNSLLLSTELLDAHTQDFAIQLKGDLKYDQDRELPFVNMLFELSNGEIEKIADYLPKTTSEKLSRWLRKSFVTGEIPSAIFVFRGWPEEFPFKNKEGVFQGFAEIIDGTLDYHPSWPPMDGIHAGIMVNGDTLTVNAASGNFFNAEVTNVNIIIEDLSRKDLKMTAVINGHINGDVKDGLLFIKDSPLQGNPSLKNLPSLNFTGGMGIDLALEIPLFPAPVFVNGSLTLRDATFTRTDMKIELTELNGTIDFTRDSFSAEGMKANFFNYPVELAIANRHGSPAETTLSGTADSQFISAQLLRYLPSLAPYKSEIEKRINGTCLWEVSLVNTDPKSNLKINEQLVITSTLEGLSIDLPAPLSKSDGPAPFSLSLRYPEVDKREINIRYANILNGLIHVSDTNGQKSVITSLSFGDKATIGNENNPFSITGDVDQLNAIEWIKLIADISNIGRPKAKDKIISLNIQVASLEFMHQNFSDVNLKLGNVNSGYHINLNADDISGDIYFDRLINDHPVIIKLDKLNLVKNTSENEEGKSEINPGSIPPLDIEISELTYDNIDLGQLNIVTSKIANDLSVDKIIFSKTDMEIAGTGIWSITNDEQHSKFNLTLNAASMKTMLETFNYDVAAIEEGETSLTLDAQWKGTPVDFSLTNLNGTLLMEIKKGRFTDVAPSAGRLFGLLSLQTLPRRLSLDFSDLFGKGLAFDNIEGRFSIENGNAYTNNLTMSGPSVNINISGRTGLVDQDYDQIATITPKVSDSLPVASALFGPIGVGVGAVIFIASEIFHSLPEKIDTLLRKQYTITGAWDDPQVTRIKQNEVENNNG